jgi:hypothetical protein
MFTLDLNGKVQETYVNGWYDGICAHYGKYGMWTMVSTHPLTRMEAVADQLKYQGDGSDCRWSIRWD